MIVSEGRLVALLDWEFAHLGDPTEDLSYCRQFVEPLIAWDDFLKGYRGAGGGDYREENARFFELWRGVRNAVCCSVSWRGVLSGAYPALKMAYQGIPLYRTFVHNTARALKEKFECEPQAVAP
jgi:aminoglycoside phosphotransferase (APT) family kinase protein